MLFSGCNVSCYRKIFQKLPDSSARHSGWVPHAMETNEKANPVAIGFLSTEAIAFDSEDSLHPLHQLHRLHHMWLSIVFIYTALLEMANRASTRILHMLPNFALPPAESMG